MAGIYIHIPFCKTKCLYCDFYSRTDITIKEKYIEALCKELSIRKSYLNGEIINTIYFGGGTPSQFDIQDFKIIFDKIAGLYTIAANPEITIEANPDDLTTQYVNGLRTLPFNRVSIGIQSFFDEELHFLNRRHTAKQATEAIKRCQLAGFTNISIDLIYGLPRQTPAMWISNLETAISLNIQHISPYHLIYEHGTPITELLNNKQINNTDEETSIRMFSDLRNILQENGFIHYEISNFAKDGYFSRHNTSYWKNKPYLGIGAAAHSYNTKIRSYNIASANRYIEGIFSGLPKITDEYLNPKDKYNDYILTGLRTMWGIDLEVIKLNFGQKMYDYCIENTNRYIKQGLLTKEGNTLKINPKGLLISDGIMSNLMYTD